MRSSRKIVATITLSLLCQFVIAGSVNVQVRSFDDKKLEELRDYYNYDSEKRDKKKDPNNSNNNNNGNNNGRNGGGGNRNNGGESSGADGASTEGGNFLIYILFGVAIVGLSVVFLSSQSGGLVWSNKRNVVEATEEDIIEDIHKMDIDSIVKEAIAKKEYRRATRLMYLNLLKRLSTKKMISWEENKTNRDYLYEIKDRSLRSEFEGTTLMYEYVWYGDAEIDESSFSIVRSSFQKLMKKVG